MNNQNPLLIELNAHVARMKIIAENSSDPTTQNLATQACAMTDSMLAQITTIMNDKAKNPTKPGEEK